MEIKVFLSDKNEKGLQDVFVEVSRIPTSGEFERMDRVIKGRAEEEGIEIGDIYIVVKEDN